MVTAGKKKKHSSIRRPSSRERSLLERLARSGNVGDPLRNVAQLKVRLPEPLRRDLERAAAGASHSMNTEIVRRLTESFKNYGRAKLIADSLLKDLDHEVLGEMFRKYVRDRLDRAPDDAAHDDDGAPDEGARSRTR